MSAATLQHKTNMMWQTVHHMHTSAVACNKSQRYYSAHHPKAHAAASHEHQTVQLALSNQIDETSNAHSRKRLPTAVTLS
jgi:hypothetical protein